MWFALNDAEIIDGLRFTVKRVGMLYPVLLDKYGNLIDGLHRLKADPTWPLFTLSHIDSDEDRLIARLIVNCCRRSVTAKEKSRMLEDLGELYLKRGVKPGAELAKKISDVTGMSLRWVMMYLPAKFKKRPGVGGPSKTPKLPNEMEVARLATDPLELEFLTAEPTKF
jgi:hypothetical protein